MKKCFTPLFKSNKATKTSTNVPVKNCFLYESQNNLLFYQGNNNNSINTTTSSVLSRVLLLLVLASASCIVSRAQITNTTIFPLNDYLTTEAGSPYPVLVQSKLDAIDTSKFVNVMDYGAKGDGVTWDDEAIENAFNDARYGVIFPSEKTFLVHKLTTIHLTKSITVYAYGATIKMDDFSKYSFLSLEYDADNYNGNVIWLGGKLWGNKKNQSWPGSPTGNDDWEEAHGRFLGINYAAFALVKDVTVVGIVMDGIGLESCKLGVIADSKAYGGAPIKYKQVQDQGTYFKCTRTGSQAFYCMNLSCDGGSIGVHYSTKEVEDNSLTVITNSHFTNQSQDALHFEDCRKIFIYNSSIESDIENEYQADVHISNRAEIVSVKSCRFRNSRIDFRNASDLQIGVVDDCKFVSEFRSKGNNKNNGNDNYSLSTFIDGGATHCINSTFTGKTNDEQAWADNVQNCSFTNFDNLALKGAHAVSNSHFKNGPDPVSPAKDGVVVNCTFDNVGRNDYKNIPINNDWQLPFSSSITILSNKLLYLGTITCGQVINYNNLSKTGGTAVASARMAAMPANSITQKHSTTGPLNLNAAHHQPVAVNTPTAISNSTAVAVQNTKIRLYPNPAADVVHVALNNKLWGKTVLNIYDQQGRLVQSKTIYKNTVSAVETIPVKILTAGTYVLHILNEHYNTALNLLVGK